MIISIGNLLVIYIVVIVGCVVEVAIMRKPIYSQTTK